MHYCQSCQNPTLMEPRDGLAVCPGCGCCDQGAAIAPLFVVTGAAAAAAAWVTGQLTGSG